MAAHARTPNRGGELGGAGTGGIGESIDIIGPSKGEEAAKFALNGAMGRLGEPAEIAKTTAFMVSDECSYLDGVDILYDGGAIAAFEVQAANRAAS